MTSTHYAYSPDTDPAFIPKDAQHALQENILREHLLYVARHSEYYRQVFAQCGIALDDVQNSAPFELLRQLPFTEKSALDQHNAQLTCVEAQDIVDLCLTSGTTAAPVSLPQTQNDQERVGFNEEISFRAAGITNQDRVLIAAAMDRCFMAGLAYFLGITRLGATAIRAGSSSFPVVMDLVDRLKPTAIVGVPTLIKAIGERFAKAGTNPASMGVDKLICIGEPIRTPDFTLSALGTRIHELWDARVFGTYAGTELATAFCECSAGCGGHVHPSLIVVEIVDEQGELLPAGQAGEVVVTPLGVTGMPLVRFKTGDVAVLYDEPCACGRLTPRLGPILGRKNQVLKYRGTTVYPPAIFTVLQEMREIRGYYIEVRDEYELSDHIRVVVGTDDAQLSATVVAERIAARVRVKPEVIVRTPQEVAAKTIQADKRKPITFFDLRGRRA